MRLNFWPLLLSVLLLTGCLNDANTDPIIIVEPGSTAFFYVGNQTETDLELTFRIVQNYAGLPDSTLSLPAGESTRIFAAGDIGSHPMPADVFKEFIFFTTASGDTTTVLTVDPVTNEIWDKTVVAKEEETEELPQGAYFTLIVTDEDLDRPGSE